MDSVAIIINNPLGENMTKLGFQSSPTNWEQGLSLLQYGTTMKYASRYIHEICKDVWTSNMQKGMNKKYSS